MNYTHTHMRHTHRHTQAKLSENSQTI